MYSYAKRKLLVSIKKADVDYQVHHPEEQQSNTPPVHEFRGQLKSIAQKQSMSKMMNKADEQKDRRSVQGDERQR